MELVICHLFILLMTILIVVSTTATPTCLRNLRGRLSLRAGRNHSHPPGEAEEGEHEGNTEEGKKKLHEARLFSWYHKPCWGDLVGDARPDEPKIPADLDKDSVWDLYFTDYDPYFWPWVAASGQDWFEKDLLSVCFVLGIYIYI